MSKVKLPDMVVVFAERITTVKCMFLKRKYLLTQTTVLGLRKMIMVRICLLSADSGEYGDFGESSDSGNKLQVSGM